MYRYKNMPGDAWHVAGSAAPGPGCLGPSPPLPRGSRATGVTERVAHCLRVPVTSTVTVMCVCCEGEIAGNAHDVLRTAGCPADTPVSGDHSFIRPSPWEEINPITLDFSISRYIY